MNTTLSTPTRLNSFSASNIDKDKGIIRDVVLCEVGPARGHGVWLNQDFVNGVVELGQASPNGIKSRFGHPNMCENAEGSYMGRFKNIKLDGTQAKGDLHFDQSATITPKFGDLQEYVSTLATTSPDMFGMSIVFSGDELDELEENEHGDEVTVMSITELHAADAVDSPAATTNLFHQFSEAQFAAKVTEFIDDNPKIFAIVDKNPQVIDEFMTKYKSYKSMKTENETQETAVTKELGEVKGILQTIKEKVFGIGQVETEMEAENKELREGLAGITAEIKEIASKFDEMADEVKTQSVLIAEQATKIETLQAENETLKTSTNELEKSAKELGEIVPSRTTKTNQPTTTGASWQKYADAAVN